MFYEKGAAPLCLAAAPVFYGGGYLPAVAIEEEFFFDDLAVFGGVDGDFVEGDGFAGVVAGDFPSGLGGEAVVAVEERAGDGFAVDLVFVGPFF